MRAIYQFARADFYERVRRYSFLITLGIVVWGGYMLLPPNPSDYITLRIGEYRGAYGSAYVGALISMAGSIYLSLMGFYLVKNAIRRDRITGVGQIIAATPVSRLAYMIGKMLSNFAVLSCIVVVLFITAGVTQFIRAEDTTLDLWALASPFLLVMLPIAAATAGLAVLFESIPLLRGGLGNVIYYFVWTFALISEIEGGSGIFGQSYIIPSIQDACAAVFSDYTPDMHKVSHGIILRDGGFNLDTFHWAGLQWTTALVASRIGIASIGLVLAGLAAAVFDRFDATASHLKGFRREPRSPEMVPATPVARPVQESNNPGPIALTPLAVNALSRFRYVELVKAELRLLMRRHGFWWQIVALGLIVAGALVPESAARSFIWPIALVWPILMWSTLGTREVRYRTDQIMFSTPRPILRHLSATWLAGVIITAVVASGMAIKLAVTGDSAGLFAWIIGIAFVPTLGLAFGILTGSGKMFEIVYLIWWYGGLMSKGPILDFIGTLEGTAQSGLPLYYLTMTAGLLAIAFIGRWRQVRG